MNSVVIVDGVRTPQGNLGGVLKDLTAQKLGEISLRALLERTKLDPKEIQEVIFGCVGQQSDAANIARVIALMAKLPIPVPAFTVQRNCASGLQAVVSGYQMIALGDADVVIAGGTESMSGAPYVNRDLRFGKKLRHSTMIDSLWEGLTDPIVNQIMGETAENLAKEFNISRKEQDQFSLLSHQRAFRATREGKFKDEIVKVSVPKKVLGKEVPSEPITADEGPNPGLTEQILSQYPTIFRENGTVTPGNSCPISDGAACLLLMSETKARALGYTPLGYIRSYGFAGVEPDRMGIGPTCSVPIALKRAKMTLKDIQLIELNEAFAAQYLACEKLMQFDRNIANVNGGAIALGHPVGATGSRLLVTLLYEMKRKNLSTGLATMCVGGGQGGAMIVERK
ncbi:MAG: acetyl-CoA acetyltransferase [Omnitrophica bacterium RIFCSPHIGHO2_02_FULL_46_11]|nr:MAG: acetyl-CoA acetyltransferase [Omnitrophica bacterium RIFCSPLOWO2_01_FULL_45_10b]OGW87230.1 MAG: acetyl-CoA acetyltransferase [Omnitrophica bacterium RIFCSPHIGHO2_02_FULL_46_11]